MDNKDLGRVPDGTGLSQAEPASRLGPSGFDPSRSSVKQKAFTADDFRAELLKIMPGYKWTVHRASKHAVRLVATGTQSSGFNRLSTLEVQRTIERERPWYKVRSAGFGTRAPWVAEIGDVTLARALRGLQSHYEYKCNSYRALMSSLQKGRTLSCDSDSDRNGEDAPQSAAECEAAQSGRSASEGIAQGDRS